MIPLGLSRTLDFWFSYNYFVNYLQIIPGFWVLKLVSFSFNGIIAERALHAEDKILPLTSASEARLKV